MIKKISVLAAMLMCAVIAHAYTVKVKVLDPDARPESYATCRIFTPSDTIHAVAGGLTDTLGIYTADIAKPGPYRLSVEVTGYKPVQRSFTVEPSDKTVDLGTVSLDVTELSELVVTAQRPLVVKQIDRIGYDVQADDDAKTSTVNEILRKVPMVNVDSDGEITINGSSNFKIYKNGRPNSSMSKNAKDIFKALPASMIKRIEVITEPGARFDAEGVAAVLNIVTVENTVIKGVMGNASVAGSSLQPFNSANIFLTSQIDKVTFSVNGGTGYQGSRQSENISDISYIYENGTRRTGCSKSTAKGWIGWGGLELSYEMDSLNLFTAEANMFAYGVKPKGFSSYEMTAADGSLISSYSSDVYYPRYQYLDLDATFAYQRSTRRKGETISLSYMVSTNRQDHHETEEFHDIVGDLFPYTARDNNYKLHFIEHTFQGDWTRPFGKIHSLDLGAKYILRRNNSKDNSVYRDWEERFTDFLHVTDIAALYAQYTARLGRFSLQAGLRYEFSKLKASYPSPSIPQSEDKAFSTTLNDLVPSAAISWQVNDANSLTLNYATRINRPGISYLNPALSISPTTVSTGNPDLESARHQSLKLSYMLIKPKFNMQASAQYGFSNNAINEFSELRDNIIYTSYANIGHEREWNFSAYIQWTPGSKTRLMFNLMASHDHVEVGNATMSHWAWGGYGSINQKLPWKLEAELGAWLMPEWSWDAYTRVNTSFGNRINPMFSLKRNFLKEDRLSVRLGWRGIFKPHRHMTISTINGPYIGNRVNTNLHNQAVSITVSYRFGSLNARVRKTKARISNDDLQGQGSQGSQGGSSQGGQGSN